MAFISSSMYDGNTPRVLCDNCGYKELKFDENGQQEDPWCWVLLWGGIVSIPPEEWEANGISEREGKGLCDNCGRRC